MEIDFTAIGVALCTVGMYGTAIGISNIFSSAIEGISRNPTVEPNVMKLAFIGAALAEAMGLFSFLIAMLLLFA